MDKFIFLLVVVKIQLFLDHDDTNLQEDSFKQNEENEIISVEIIGKKQDIFEITKMIEENYETCHFKIYNKV